ncbi:MAG TPA: hypothetical protein VHG51_00015 [Longimicrobiaceae bacterium]|nr:hypothetical protein [Longimicrobiaceae bacterium]
MKRLRFAPAASLLFALSLGACSDGPSGPGNGGGGGGGVNLQVGTLYLVQSVQNRDGTVPLVANRDAFIRVFAVADRANTATPSVRVRVFHGQTLRETWDIPAPGSSVPTSVDQSSLTNSWNVLVPGALVQPGMRVVAEVDPGNTVSEANEGDNQYTTSPQQVDVAVVPPFKVRFVPIHQLENGLTGRVNEANKDAFLVLTQKIHPVAAVDSDLRAPYTVRGLGFDPQGNTWIATVSELDAVRVAEGSDRYYYGVVQAPYAGGGVVGIAAGIPSRTSLGWDRAGDASETMAHELGHNWGRFHAPCGGAAGSDPTYPYSLGLIGVFGMDVAARDLKTPSAYTDIMGYCDQQFWISDYTFRAIYAYRMANDAAASRAPQPSLLVWGRILDGELVLEPAFQVTTRPSLPRSGGRYTVEGLDASGGVLFSVSFDGERIPDLPGDKRHFAFAVPLGPDAASRLATLRLAGNGEATERRATAATAPQHGAVQPFERVAATRSGSGEASLRWDPARYPMVMVRNARTGEILSLARDGSARVAGAAGELELVLSDGVRSVVRRAP